MYLYTYIWVWRFAVKHLLTFLLCSFDVITLYDILLSRMGHLDNDSIHVHVRLCVFLRHPVHNVRERVRSLSLCVK